MGSTATRVMLALGTSALVALGLAAPVSADGVWHQAYGRASADQACPAPADETPWQDSFDGQREWTPSWAQWMNAGQGGWVCQRTLVWAQSPAPTGPGCQFVDRVSDVDLYAAFGSSATLRSGPRYTDASCTTVLDSQEWEYLLYAPGISTPTAIEVCTATFGFGSGAYQLFDNQDIWDCNAA